MYYFNKFIILEVYDNNSYFVNYSYDLISKKFNCLKGNCDKYKNYIEFMENSVKNFTQKWRKIDFANAKSILLYFFFAFLVWLDWEGKYYEKDYNYFKYFILYWCKCIN